MKDTQFLVNKNDLRDYRVDSNELVDGSALAPDQVLLAVDQFALTANNITYAVAGDTMGYWQFFPGPEGWGRIPVWGYATVVASNHPDIKSGERVYGYLPMGTHLTIDAGRVTQSQLIDAAPHRSALPAVYNQFLRVASEKNADQEALQMLYRPLFMTSWLLDDFLAHNEFFGAEQVILTSASSKTSIGLAFMLAARGDRPVIGLTSPGNTRFVESLGCYDQVVSYDDINGLDATKNTVSVDMAGNGATLADLHNHFGDALQYSCLVGATHWDARAGARAMAGPKPELFFAPNHIKSRNADWGPGGLEERFDASWQSFINNVGDWIAVQHVQGAEATAEVYLAQLAGTAKPDVGYIVSL